MGWIPHPRTPERRRAWRAAALWATAAIIAVAVYAGAYRWARMAGVVDDYSQNRPPDGWSSSRLCNAAFIPAYAVEIRWRAWRMRAAWRQLAAAGLCTVATPYDDTVLPRYWFCRGYVDGMICDEPLFLIDPCGTHHVGVSAGRGALMRYLRDHASRQGDTAPWSVHSYGGELVVMADAGIHARLQTALQQLRLGLQR
jgi:hypothetical protein